MNDDGEGATRASPNHPHSTFKAQDTSPKVLNNL